MKTLRLFCIIAASTIVPLCGIPVNSEPLAQSPSVTFKIEITNPKNGAVLKTIPFIEGKATALDEGCFVDVEIQRENDGAFWDGYASVWRSSENPLRARVNKGKWRIGERLPQGEQLQEGGYAIIATLMEGRTERAQQKVRITIKNGRTAPDSTKITGPEGRGGLRVLDAPVMPPPRPTLPPAPVSTPFIIVFTSKRDGNSEIYSMKSDGSNVTRLTNNSAEDEWPCMNRDGNKIVFVSERNGYKQLFTMNVDGTAQTALSITGAIHPSWNPDATKISYESTGGGTYVANADGTGARQLSYTSAAHDPVWSPDMNMVGYCLNNYIYQSDITSNYQNRITLYQRARKNPAYDLDAFHMVWESDGKIFTLDTIAANADDVQITADDMLASDPVFSPDGKGIIFHGWQNVDKEPELWMIDLQGENLVQLTNNDAFDGQASCPSSRFPVDGMVATPANFSASNYTGNNVYNTTGAGQTVMQILPFNSPQTLYYRVQNDWHTPLTYRIKAPTPPVGWTVNYTYVSNGNNVDVTTAVNGTGWDTSSLWPGGEAGLRVDVNCSTGAAPGTSFDLPLRAEVVNGAEADVARIILLRDWAVDAEIRSFNQLGWVGAGEYSSDGTGQTAAQALIQMSDSPVSFFVKAKNLGDVAQPLRISASAAGPGWTARFFDAIRGGSDITSQVAGAGWLTPALASGNSQIIRMEMTLTSDHTLGQLVENLIRVDATQGAASDVVKAKLGLQRIQKIQYSLDYGLSWQDAPSSGITITGTAKMPLGLRAVPIYPDLPWPSQPQWQPRWIDNEGTKIGAQIWLRYESPLAQAQTVTANCGNTLSVQANVAPYSP